MERRGSLAHGEGKGGKDERRPSELPGAGGAGEDGDVSTEEAIQLLTACQGEDCEPNPPKSRPAPRAGAAPRPAGRAPPAPWPSPAPLSGPMPPAEPMSPRRRVRRDGGGGERERERAQAADRRVRPALLRRCPAMPAAVQA